MSKKHRINYSDYSSWSKDVDVSNENQNKAEVADKKHYATVRCRNRLNVRFSPEVADNVMCTLLNNSSVEVLGYDPLGNDAWTKIRCENNGVSIEGFVMSEFLEV